jgi:hypothetical protein
VTGNNLNDKNEHSAIYGEAQRKAAFIILQHTHGYWKIDADHYIQR